jgi:hypothetical protein
VGTGEEVADSYAGGEASNPSGHAMVCDRQRV